MNEFIHTFSVTTHFSADEWEQFTASYSLNKEIIYDNDCYNEKVIYFIKYADNGLRMELKFTPSLERKYDKEHKKYKAKWIITPAKLLHIGQAMCKLHSRAEYEKACCELFCIINEINSTTGIDIWRKAKLQRIDVSKDVEMPSEEYACEVMRLAKTALHHKEFTSENLPSLLGNVLGDAEELMQAHITSPLWDGDMYSKGIQKNRIRFWCDSKKAKQKKMLKYAEAINKGKECDNAAVKNYFAEMNMSPIYVKKEFRHIPSFAYILSQDRIEAEV